MQLGMIGLGRMGASMVRRLLGKNVECVVHDARPAAVASVRDAGAQSAASLEELVSKMTQPRAIWIMVPAGAVDKILDELAAHLQAGDIVIDRGYCLMIGGEANIVQHLERIFRALVPGVDAAPRTPGRSGAAGNVEQGFLHCGAHGAGHFVKMIHNGIEYGIMAAYAEGLNILRHANIGNQTFASDAETTPLRDPQFYQYEMNLPLIAEVWRRGSVIGSWLLDLTAEALLKSPQLESYSGRVSDSGEGRWTVLAAIDEAVPAPVLSAALYQRFASRGQAEFADQLLSAMRHEFGGHVETTAEKAK